MTMPNIKLGHPSLIDVPAKPQDAYLPGHFDMAYEGLYNTAKCWYDATNNGLLIHQPIHRLLQHSNFRHFNELMVALGIPKEYAREFKMSLAHFKGSLHDFLVFYKNNPDIFQTADFFEPTVVQQPCKNESKKVQIKPVIKRRFFSALFSKYHTLRHRICHLFKKPHFSYKPISTKAKILAYKKDYFLQHQRAWRNVAVALPFISLWTLGYRHVTHTDFPANDNQNNTTIVTNNSLGINVSAAANQASVVDFKNVKSSSIRQIAQKIIPSLQDLINNNGASAKNSSNNSLSAQQNQYEAQLIAQKDADLAEFSKLYRQCSYNNYVKLSNGYKKETFKSANRTLKNHGIKPLHPRLYCAGMSIASLCQAQDIFKQKHPDSYIIPAIDEILKNCHNVHHSATLKKDLKKITNNYAYSTNPTTDIKNYMQTHKNAIVFLWTPRGGGNYHHQTFFPTKASNNLYTYSSFNRQRWGNQNDFKNFMSSKRGAGCYFTDFAEGLDNIATKYIEKDVEKHNFDLAQNAFPALYKWAKISRV